jgi:hypothetical protein
MTRYKNISKENDIPSVLHDFERAEVSELEEALAENKNKKSILTDSLNIQPLKYSDLKSNKWKPNLRKSILKNIHNTKEYINSNTLHA